MKQGTGDQRSGNFCREGYSGKEKSYCPLKCVITIVARLQNFVQSNLCGKRRRSYER